MQVYSYKRNPKQEPSKKKSFKEKKKVCVIDINKYSILSLFRKITIKILHIFF